MNVILYPIPAALSFGLVALAAFLWALRSGQFDDLDGTAHGILFADNDRDGAERQNHTACRRRYS